MRIPHWERCDANWRQHLDGVCIDVYDLSMKSADLIKQIEQAGWVLRNVAGSHHVFRHPEHGGHISVPHPKKDLGAGLVNKLLKQAGLK